MTDSPETYEDHLRAIADAESAHEAANEQMQAATAAEARAHAAVGSAWAAWRIFTRAQAAALERPAAN